MRHRLSLWLIVVVLTLMSIWQFRRLRQLEENQLQLATQNQKLAAALETALKIEIMLVEKNEYLIMMYRSVQAMRDEIEQRQTAINDSLERYPQLPPEFEYQP